MLIRSMGNDDPILRLRWTSSMPDVHASDAVDQDEPFAPAQPKIPQPDPHLEAVSQDYIPVSVQHDDQCEAAPEVRIPEPTRIRQKQAPRFVELPLRRTTARDYLAQVQRKSVVVLIATAIGIAAGAIASFAAPNTYSATAVLISPKPDAALLQTELAVLHSDEVASAIVDQLGVARLALRPPQYGAFAPLSFAFSNAPAPSDRSRALAVVSAALDASVSDSGSHDNAPHSVRFTIRHGDPALAADLLEAAIASERQARGKIKALTQSGALGLQLGAARRELEDIQIESAGLRTEGSVSDIAQETVATAAQANTLAGRQSELELRQSAVLAELAKARELLKATPAKIFGSQENNRREAGHEARSLILQLQIERSHLIEQYSSGYFGILEIERKIKVAEAHTHGQQIVAGSISREVRNPAYDVLLLRIAALEPEMNGLAAERLEVLRQSGQNARRVMELRGVSTTLGALRRRSEAGEATIRDIAQNLSRVQLQETLFVAQLDGLRWLAQSPVKMMSMPHADIYLPLGALAGLLCGVALSATRARRSEHYAVAGEVERHLALAQLANLRLWRSGVSQPLPPAALGNLIHVMTHALGSRHAPMTVIHLMATDAEDGAGRVARSLANVWLNDQTASVLVIHLGKKGLGKIESFRPDKTIDDARVTVLEQTLLESKPSLASAVIGAPDFVLAILEDSHSNSETLGLQVERLRSLHDVLLIVTACEHDPALTARISAAVDLNVLMVRAGHSNRSKVAALCDILGQHDLRPLGFVFVT